jgi:Flp pilus assembly protein TadD
VFVRESQLAELKTQIDSCPDDVKLRFQLADLLAQTNQRCEAIAEYREVLQRQPTHRQARADLGKLLLLSGDRIAARQLYTEGLEQDPEDRENRVILGSLLVDANEPDSARQHFEAVLRIDPDHSGAHAGMYYALKKLGDEQHLEWHRRKGFQDRYLFRVPYRGKSKPISALLLAPSTGGIAPIDKFMDVRIFQTDIVVADFYDLSVSLPKHQLVVNAIGDADTDREALFAAESLLTYTFAPVVNRPLAVLSTGRCNNSQRFSKMPGVVTPKMAILSREVLMSAEVDIVLAQRGFKFPLLLRAPGYHLGQYFLRVDNPEALSAAVEEIPGRELIVIQYLDVRSADGQVRKYRVMMIDGQLYPLHLAISNHWKVHYFSANMSESPENRAEDAAFLSDMPNALGPSVMTSLRRLQVTLGLDYGGVDFSLNSRGDLVVFEANATMVVEPPPPDEKWDYRTTAVKQIYEAVRRMLVSRAIAFSPPL